MPASEGIFPEPFSVKPAQEFIAKIQSIFAEAFIDGFERSRGLQCVDGAVVTIQQREYFVPLLRYGTRPIAFADRLEVKQKLNDMVDFGITSPVTEPSDWAAPMVVLLNKDGFLRLCVDHTKLNKDVRHPTHPVRIPRDAVSEIEREDSCFTCFDSANGSKNHSTKEPNSLRSS